MFVWESYRKKCEWTQKIQVEKSNDGPKERKQKCFFPPWIFPGLLEDPSYPEKKRQTHNITSANKRWEFPQNSLCQEKLRVSSTLLSTQQDWSGKIGIDIKSIGCSWICHNDHSNVILSNSKFDFSEHLLSNRVIAFIIINQVLEFCLRFKCYIGGIAYTVNNNFIFSLFLTQSYCKASENHHKAI